MKAILAIDSFKGCLTSEQAENAALSAFKEGDAAAFPVSDGGEGFSTIVTQLLGGSFKTVDCADPLGRPMKARYGISRSGRIAVICTADASGLGLVREDERNPLAESSYGTGQLMADALDEGVEEIWLGLGGTATCDGGTGMLQALGYRFMAPGGMLEPWRTVLGNIQSIDSSKRNKGLQDCRITGFYDVSVPFYGEGGATRMFGPQKGAGPEMVDALDNWMAQLCNAYSRFAGREIRNIPGSGAAGGIGGALRACFRATMSPGTWQVLDLAGFGNALDSCSVVITGEGRSDRQTLQGKVPMGVLDYVRKYDSECRCGRQTKVILMAGSVSDKDLLLDAGFSKVIQVTPDGMPLSEAMIPDVAERNIRDAMAEIEI